MAEAGACRGGCAGGLGRVNPGPPPSAICVGATHASPLYLCSWDFSPPAGHFGARQNTLRRASAKDLGEVDRLVPSPSAERCANTRPVVLSAQEIGPVARAVHPPLNCLSRSSVQASQGCFDSDILGDPVMAPLPAAIPRPVDSIRRPQPFGRVVAEVSPIRHVIAVSPGHGRQLLLPLEW